MVGSPNDDGEENGAALREMRRVLKPTGRAYVSTPVPNDFMERFHGVVARHLGEQPAGFLRAVFSMNDPRKLETLLTGSGFSSASARVHARDVQLPPARDFLWQYIGSTPLAEAAAKAGAARREALEREVCARWQPFVADGSMSLQVGMTTASARK